MEPQVQNATHVNQKAFNGGVSHRGIPFLIVIQVLRSSTPEQIHILSVPDLPVDGFLSESVRPVALMEAATWISASAYEVADQG